MGEQPNLPIKVSIISDMMLNFDDDFDGHSDGDVTFKQTFTTESFYVILRVHSHLRFPSCELLRELFAK